MSGKWAKYNEQLLEAIARKDLGGMMSCVQQGAHVNRICQNGMTPLGAAAETGSLYVLKALTDCNKKYLTHRSTENKRPIKLRLEESHSKRNIGYFVFSADVEELDSEGPTPEGMEALEWDLEVTEEKSPEKFASPASPEAAIYKWYAKILNQTAIILKSPENDITRLDRHGQNVLHYAVQDGCVDMVEFLLEEFKEFNINQCNLSWHTPLHLATIRGNYDVVKYLLEHGADVNAYTMRRMTALHFAANGNKLEIVKLLLHKGANPNVFDEDDRSPLTLSVENDNFEISRILVKRGVRLNQEETNGCTPLYRAVVNDSTRIAKLLVDAGAKIVHSHQLLHIATKNNNLDMVRILESGGGILNLRDDHGYTPLMCACIIQSIPIAEYLLTRGMPANSVNQVNGDTPLHLILAGIKANPHLEIFFDLLVSYGADLDIVTLQGGLFFHALVNRNFEGAKLLVKYGLDVNKVDDYTMNNYALIAKKHGNPELVRYVIAAGFNFKKWKVKIQDFYLDSENDPLYQFIYDRMNSVPTLRELSKISVRSMYKGKNLCSEIENLPLPKILKEYVTLNRLVI